jgi:hypothetical protein
LAIAIFGQVVAVATHGTKLVALAELVAVAADKAAQQDWVTLKD